MVLRAIPVASLTAAIPPHPAASASAAANRRQLRFIQHWTECLVAELYGGDIDHPAYLQSKTKNGNPKK